MSACGSCGAEIQWFTTEAGKAMPLDPEPREDGNVILLGGGRVRVCGPLELIDWDGHRFVSHFATCAHAAQWRKR